MPGSPQPARRPDAEPQVPQHGGFRRLKSFQIAQLVCDVAVRFCDKYIDPRSRTHDQMVQAARAVVENVAESCQASNKSKKTELKFMSAATSSLNELQLDLEDFLHQHGRKVWSQDDPRWASLLDRRCKTADEVADWAKETYTLAKHPSIALAAADGGSSIAPPVVPGKSTYPEIAANAAIVLIAVARSHLDRQLAALKRAAGQQRGFIRQPDQIPSDKPGSE